MVSMVNKLKNGEQVEKNVEKLKKLCQSCKILKKKNKKKFKICERKTLLRKTRNTVKKSKIMDCGEKVKNFEVIK